MGNNTDNMAKRSLINDQLLNILLEDVDELNEDLDEFIEEYEQASEIGSVCSKRRVVVYVRE